MIDFSYTCDQCFRPRRSATTRLCVDHAPICRLCEGPAGNESDAHDLCADCATVAHHATCWGEAERRKPTPRTLASYPAHKQEFLLVAADDGLEPLREQDFRTLMRWYARASLARNEASRRVAN